MQALLFLDSERLHNPEDYILCENIDEFIKIHSLGVTQTKFGIELKKYCKIHGFDNVISKNKKLNGEAKRCWFGIKRDF